MMKMFRSLFIIIVTFASTEATSFADLLKGRGDGDNSVLEDEVKIPGLGKTNFFDFNNYKKGSGEAAPRAIEDQVFPGFGQFESSNSGRNDDNDERLPCGTDGAFSNFVGLCNIPELSPFCGGLEAFGLLDMVANPNNKNTIFLFPEEGIENFARLFQGQPPFTEKEWRKLFKFHIVEDRFVKPNELICGENIRTSTKDRTKPFFPQIECDYNILGEFESFISLGSNSFALGNQPLFIDSQNNPPLIACNANVYFISNVLAPKFVKKYLDNPRVKCSSKSESRSLKALEDYDKFPNTGLVLSGVNTLLNPPPEQEFVEVTPYLFTADRFCPEDADKFCLKLCKQAKECTAVQTDNFDPPSFQNGQAVFFCNLANGGIPNHPVFKSALPDIAQRQVTTTYVSKKGPEVKDYTTSLIIPPNPNLPEGSEDFRDFVFPGLLCVATKGFTAEFDVTIADECQACIVSRLLEFPSCECIAKNICQDGGLFNNGFCDDKCGPSLCIPDVRRSALTTIGQAFAPAPGLEPPIPPGGIIFSCLSRDVFDPEKGEIIPPYTCPDSSGPYDFECDDFLE